MTLKALYWWWWWWSFAKSCPTLCDPMDCNPSNSSVQGISQAKILEVGCHFLLQGIFCPQDQTQISGIGRRSPAL